MENRGARIHRVRARAGMFWIEVLIGRNVAEDILIAALRVDAMLENYAIVFRYMTEHEAVVEIALGAAVPVVHERDVSIFPVVLEASTGERGGRTNVVLLMNREVGIPRGRVAIVVAILIVQPTGVSELFASIKQRLHALPSACL